MRHHARLSRALSTALVTSLIGLVILACDETPTVTLLFDRSTSDLTTHVFPTDLYKGDVVLDRFTEPQIAITPFVQQLKYTFQLGFAPTTGIRIPFSPSPNDSDRWIDPATVTDGVRVYRVSTAATTRVALGEVQVQPRTNAVLARPRAPWAPGHYAVAVLPSLRTRAGDPISPSADYQIATRDGDSLTDADLVAVAAVDPDITDRGDTLAFFSFTVADATGPMRLLKSYISGLTPVDKAGVDEVLDITAIGPPESRELAVGGARVVAQGDAQIEALFAGAGVGALPKSAIAAVIGGAISTPVFVADPIPDARQLFANGTFQGRDPLRPFSPENPLSLSQATPTRLLPYLMVIPKQHLPEMPVIIALHGITRTKEDWLAFANTACATGHALIAIDLYQHGARQADIDPPEGDFSAKVDPVLAASGVAFPDPFINPTFLARTRDKLRQSVVDNLALLRLVAAGDGTNPLIDFDGDAAPDHFGPIRVAAMSLGAILATSMVSVSPEVDRVLLNVPATHLTQIINDSPRLSKDLDLLIYATATAQGIGLLAGSPRFMVPDGPERELFTAVSDTILGPIDPATFAAHLVTGDLGGAPRVLVQIVQGDQVVTERGSVRFAQALGSGAEDPSEVVALGPLLFPLDLTTVTLGESDPLPPIAIAEHSGGHGFLLDFEDPAATSAAQKQAALFFASP